MASLPSDEAAGERDEGTDPRIRETYDEYGVSGRRFALIGDPANENAWIQSDYTVEIQR